MTLRAATLAVLCTLSLVAVATPVRHDISVSLDPATRRLVASDVIELPVGEAPSVLLIGAEFELDSLRVDGQVPAHAGEVRDGVRRLRLPAGARRVELAWRGELAALDAGQSHRETLRAARAVADPGGSFLPDAALWYPRIGNAPLSYRLRLALPLGQRGLVPGTLVSEQEDADGWRATFLVDHPAEGIDLMAGPYTVTRREMPAADGRTLQLRTWFHPGLESLADGYLDSVAGYIALYEEWIGDYAFAGYNVVSSPTPTGFGMPGLTYLGIDVLRLPFIRHTSLGHEVLHDWWGNGVYVDYARGNWAEGLTTFMADYHYRERSDAAAARDMRLGWLRDFAAVPPSEDRPLVDFRSRRHGASQVVGYNKTAMLFFMLRERIGADAFARGVARLWREQRFATAGWRDLQLAFEAETGTSLDAAFAPWLTRAGAPAVNIAAASADGDGVRVTLTQTAPAWPLRLPLEFDTPAGPQTRIVGFDQSRAEIHVALAGAATAVRLDPDLRLFRRLAEGEAPPILRDLMLSAAPRMLLLAGVDPRAAEALAARLFDHPPRLVASAAQGGDEALLVIGLHADIDAWLTANRLPPRPPETPAAAGSAGVWTSRDASGIVVTLISLADGDALAPLLRPLPHYGRQSWLVFDGRRASARGTWPATSPRVPVLARP